MLESLILKPEAFGLDISDSSIKVVRLKKKKEFFDLVSFGKTPVAPGAIKRGEVKQENNLVQAIRQSVAQVQGKKINTKYVIASLPEEKAFLQVIQMPRLPAEDLKSAVIYEAENYIPLPIEEVYLDSQVIQPLANHLDHQDVLIAALPKKMVDPYLSSLRAAGLKPLALEIESLAIARALVKSEKSSFPLLLIDLGTTRTSFIVFSGNSLRFTASISVSSGKFTEAIARTLKIDQEEAEQLKLKYGLQAKSTAEGSEVFNALVPALTDLTEQIRKYLDYYQTHSSHEHLPPNGKEFSKILLCGGGANLKGLGDFLSRSLNLPVELGDPWINVVLDGKKQKMILPFKESLSFATAIGLALRGARKD